MSSCIAKTAVKSTAKEVVAELNERDSKKDGASLEVAIGAAEDAALPCTADDGAASPGPSAVTAADAQPTPAVNPLADAELDLD